MGTARRFCILLGAAALAMPAAAQFSDSFNFLKAVKDRKGDEVMTYLNKPGQPVLNARDGDSGDTATMMATRAHDTQYLSFFLARGADPSIKDRQGTAPIHVAAQSGDIESVTLLLRAGASANAVNANGETPLILAVHNRDLPMIRLLLTNRANPDQADTIAGQSARDYAHNDRRGAAVVKLFDEVKPTAAKAVVGPTR